MALILVVDDDDLLRKTVRAMLESVGHRTVDAVDGVDGLNQFRQQSFDLVICDLFMPNKQGFDTIKEMRESAPNLPIIAMTGGVPANQSGADTDYLQSAVGSGATLSIAKPFAYRDLLTLVQQCLQGGTEGTS